MIASDWMVTKHVLPGQDKSRIRFREERSKNLLTSTFFYLRGASFLSLAAEFENDRKEETNETTISYHRHDCIFPVCRKWPPCTRRHCRRPNIGTGNGNTGQSGQQEGDAGISGR